MKNFIPKAELFYALSYFFDSPKITESQILYFSDFIENLVFSAELISEEVSNPTPKEKLYRQLIKSLGIDSVLSFRNLDEDFSIPLSTNKSIYDYINLYSSFDLDKFKKGINNILYNNVPSEKILNQIKPEFRDFVMNLEVGEKIASDFFDVDFSNLPLALQKWIGQSDLPFSKFIESNLGLYSSVIFHLIDEPMQYSKKEGLNFLPMHTFSNVLSNKPFYSFSRKNTLNKLENIISEEELKIYELIDEKFSFQFSMPLIAKYIISKASSKKEIIKIALELRQSKEVRDFTNWCELVDEALRNGNRKNALSMIEESEEYIRKIKRKKNIDRKVSIRLSFPPAFIVDMKKTDFIESEFQFALLKEFYNSNLTSSWLIEKLKKLK